MLRVQRGGAICEGLNGAEAGADLGSTNCQLMLCSPNSPSPSNIRLEPRSHLEGPCWKVGTLQAGWTESGPRVPWGSWRPWPCSLEGARLTQI